MKKITVMQDGIKECGAACLLSIIRYYGGNVSLERVLELTNTTKEGTNFYDLQSAAKEIGLISKGYKIENVDKLLNIEKPFICQVIKNNYTHFVVIYKMKKGKITMMDPSVGLINININQFIKMWTGYILLIQPYKKLPIYEETNYLTFILKKVIINNKEIIFQILSLTAMTTLFTCIYSYYFKVIVDKVIDTNKFNVLIITIIFLLILSIKIFVAYLRNNLLLYLNQKIDLSIITTTIHKIISLPYSYYKNKTTGEMISRINDLFYIKNSISRIIITIFLDSVLAVLTWLILFHMNKTMASILLIIIMLYMFIFFLFRPSIKSMTKIEQEDNAKINSFLVESISSYETIKGLNLEEFFEKKINKLYLNSSNNSLIFTRILNNKELLNTFFESVLLLWITYLGINLVMDKSLTMGSLITFNSLVYYSINPVKTLLDFYKDVFYVKNSIQRINNVLNYKYEKLDKFTNLNVEGDIVLKNLSFSYNSKNQVLHDISLVVRNKDKVLLKGTSGSGKSTLLKLIYKYYEVERDKIYIDCFDINDFSLGDIRKNITYIAQNEILYNDTIKNNIVLGRDIDDTTFIHVCNIVYVNEIIKENMLSYNYTIEENGANLSGGQRQRIILARALLKNSNIFLIDEGLNEIDIKLERKILTNLFSYYREKTFIIISHRLENMDLYNRVINIENGLLKEVLVKR